MLKVHTLTLGLYQTNTYIIHEKNAKSCCIIDPGYQPRTILEKVSSLGLNVEAILLTHGHFDHVGAVKELAADTGCRVFLCPADRAMPTMMTAGKLFYTDAYGEGDVLQLSGLSIHVIQTPGHTPGSVCLLCEDSMFCGDTLFAGSCGRTDLPGGDYVVLRRSLKRLADMETDFRLFPGHGEATSLILEQQTNPYLR